MAPDGHVGTALAGTLWDGRASILPSGVTFDFAALDAPLVPAGDGVPVRACEAAFYRGAFWNRYRPGLSHHGRGLLLRQAGLASSTQFSAVMRAVAHPTRAAVSGVPMVEAFTNTFLGILLPETVFSGGAPKPKLQAKSDWLYEAAIREGVIHRVLEHLGLLETPTVDRFVSERDHDLRAALVCLLTARFAHAGTGTSVGDETGGWFWLPPHDLWATWEMESLETNLLHLQNAKHPKSACSRKTTSTDNDSLWVISPNEAKERDRCSDFQPKSTGSQ